MQAHLQLLFQMQTVFGCKRACKDKKKFLKMPNARQTLI